MPSQRNFLRAELLFKLMAMPFVISLTLLLLSQAARGEEGLSLPASTELSTFEQ